MAIVSDLLDVSSEIADHVLQLLARVEASLK
jgi:hypothetical protein